MKKMARYIMTGRHVGKKQEDPVKSKKSYTIYDSCYSCPLSVYIRVVCDQDFEALIIDGNPSLLELKEAWNKILNEYYELSGNMSNRSVNLKEYYIYRSQIVGFSLCLKLILLGEVGYVIEYLNNLGLRCKLPNNKVEENKLIEDIKNKIHERNIRLKKAQADLDIKESNNKVTKYQFTEQLVGISKWLGFRIGADITVAEYVSYLKNMKEYVEMMKMKKYV